jgi:hypothetical protein
MMDLTRAERLLSRFHLRDLHSKAKVPFIFKRNQKKLSAAAQKQVDAGKPIRLIVDKARRTGCSSWTEGILFCHAIAVAGAHALIAAHQHRSSKALFSIPKGFAKEAGFLKLRAIERQIFFPHPSEESILEIVTAGKDTTGRGFTLTALHLSEAAHYKDPDIFSSVLPAVSEHLDTAIVIESTPKGMEGDGEAFYETWMDAVEGRSDYSPVFLSWLDDDKCVADPHLAKDAPIDDDERDLLKRKATRAQLAWRRLKINSPECGGMVELFHQEFPCLVAGTMVSHDGGIIPIERAKEAVGLNSERGTITNWKKNPPLDIWKLTTKYGRELRGTGHHPIVHTSGNLIPLAVLAPGEAIQLQPPMFAKSECRHLWAPVSHCTAELTVTPGWCRFMGYFMGDGSWYSDTLSLCGEAKDREVYEDCGRLLRNLFNTEPHLRQIRGAFEWRKHLPDVRGLLASMGLIRQTANATKSWTRWVHVPECVWRSPKECVREFLRGLFESDGCASCNIVRMGTRYKHFAQEVQLLLLGFGINAEIRPETRWASGRQFICYAVYLYRNAAALFHEYIGFVGERKRTSFRPISSKGRPPKKHEMVDYVESVRPDGVEETYDLTVRPGHLFGANGILTHNTTWEESFVSSGLPAFEETERQWASANIMDPKWRGFIDRTTDGTLKLRQHHKGDLSIWADPVAGHYYYTGVDAARGDEDRKETRDFAASTCIDGTNGLQAWRYCGYVVPEYHGCFLNSLGRKYNESMINGEVTGGYGYGTLYTLRDVLAYPNLYRWKGKHDEVYTASNWRKSAWFETTSHTRTMLFESARISLREAATTEGEFGVTIYDDLTAQQVRRATRVDSGRIEVRKGHDDILFAFMLANIAMRQWAPPRISNAILNPEAAEERQATSTMKKLGYEVLDDASLSLQRHIQKIERYNDRHPHQDEYDTDMVNA